MVEILPAVLVKDFKELKADIERLRGVSKRVQIDAVDGVYARGRTWPYRDSATFEKIVKDEGGLPDWDKMDFEFDLMVAEPLGELMKYVYAGASSIIIHAASSGSPSALQKLVDLREESGAFRLRAGLALRAVDQPDILEEFEAQYDFVQIMGIDLEGRQGEEFDRRALYLLERLHRRYPALPLQVDGGTATHVRELAAAGASHIVVGSALLRAKDPAAEYKRLYTEANAQ